MHFFCPTTGARLIAPGVSSKAGGNAPEHDGSPTHEAASSAAHAALVACRLSPTEHAPSADAVAKALAAALGVLTEPAPKPAAAQMSQPPKGSRATP